MGEKELTLRPEVAAFAQMMEFHLRRNDHKPGWKVDDPEDLIIRVSEEVIELNRAVRRHRHQAMATAAMRSVDEIPFGMSADTGSEVSKEAADVANFAMMIADVCGCFGHAAGGGVGAVASPSELHDAVAHGILEDEPLEPIAGKVIQFSMGGYPGEAFDIGCSADECAMMVVVPGAAVTGKMMGSILNAAVSITLAEVPS